MLHDFGFHHMLTRVLLNLLHSLSLIPRFDYIRNWITLEVTADTDNLMIRQIWTLNFTLKILLIYSF